jgi:hypothetical protein
LGGGFGCEKKAEKKNTARRPALSSSLKIWLFLLLYVPSAFLMEFPTELAKQATRASELTWNSRNWRNKRGCRLRTDKE